MATLVITSFKKVDKYGLPVLDGTEVSESVTFTSAASSAVIADGVRYIHLNPSAACYVKVGAAPTATATSAYIPATVTTGFTWAGNGLKISVYDGST